MTGVSIRGDGVAAACCERLLNQAGVPTSWTTLGRPQLPVIMLSGAALSLIGDVFGPIESLANAHRIRRRVVSWGPNHNPVTVEHAAVVVSEQTLLSALGTGSSGTEDFDWEILTASALLPKTEQHQFGQRRATAVSVTLRDRADSSACWVESVDAGWLFLIPNGVKTGYLLAVGNSPERLLDSSELIAKRIEQLGSIAGEFPAHPRMSWPLCGPGWIACGSAAMAFDPLCGDGTAQAIREAILGAAVIQSIAQGADAGPLLSHYQTRLGAGLYRHLALCEEFYRTGFESAWWKKEWRSTKRGAEWCATRIGNAPKFRFQLQEFALRPVS